MLQLIGYRETHLQLVEWDGQNNIIIIIIINNNNNNNNNMN